MKHIHTNTARSRVFKPLLNSQSVQAAMMNFYAPPAYTEDGEVRPSVH